MQVFTKRVWTAVGIAGAVLVSAWVLSSLLYGLLLLFAGALFGVVLSRLSLHLGNLLGVSYGVAYGIVMALLAAAALGMAFFLGAQIAAQAGKFVSELQNASGSLQQQLESQPWWSQFREFEQQAQKALSSQKAVSTATSAASSLLGGVGGGVIVLVLAAYFALRPEWYRGGLLTLVPPDGRERAAEVLTKVGASLWYWFLGRLVGMLVIGTGTTIGLWFLDVPLPFSLGVLAGLLTFVPNIGPIIALIPALLLSMQQGASTALYVVLFYFALQTVESYLLTPLIEQHQVSLPPGVTLSAQLLIGMAAGVLGLFLATPMTVVLTILLRELYVKDLLGAEPAIRSA